MQVIVQSKSKSYELPTHVEIIYSALNDNCTTVC